MKAPSIALLLLASLQVPLILATQAETARTNHIVREVGSMKWAENDRPIEHSLPFETSRDGFIYIGLKGDSDLRQNVTLVIDEGPDAIDFAIPARPEAMLRLPAGKHTLKIEAKAGAGLREVIVREVPEIHFFSLDEHLKAIEKTAPHAQKRTYQQLKKAGLLDVFNVVVSEPKYEVHRHEAEIKEWRKSGRRWLLKTSMPGDGESIEGIEAQWIGPMSHELSDGVIVDEFSPKENHRWLFPHWSKALQEIAQRPSLKEKSFYAFSGLGHAEVYQPLAEGLLNAGYKIAPEAYFRSRRTLLKAPLLMNEWRAKVPGIEKQMIIYLGPNNMATGMTFHLKPDENYKVFVEQQMQMLATHPAYEGLAGVGIWAARVMDDDILRWYVQLVRHYLIEGRSDLLSKDPFLLPHLANPGFEAGEEGWRLARAEPESLQIKSADILPFKKRPYSSLPDGKRLLYTKRSLAQANTASQTVRNLTPGRLYHLNIYTLNLSDPQAAKALEVGIHLKGVSLVEEASTNKAIPTAISSTQTPTDKGDELTFLAPDKGSGKTRVSWTHHHRLFRATGETAELTLSDWETPEKATGQEGQEIVWDFVELAPDASLDSIGPGQRD